MGSITALRRPILPDDVFRLIEGFMFGEYDTLYIIATNDTGVHTASAGELPVVFNSPDTAQESNVVRLVRKS